MSTKNIPTRPSSHSHCPVQVTPAPQTASVQLGSRLPSQSDMGIAVGIPIQGQDGTPSRKCREETVSRVPALPK